MATDDSRFIPNFVPSLKHLMAVKYAVPLFQRFGGATLERVAEEIEAKRPNRGNEDVAYRSARGILERMNEGVRREVTRVVRGMYGSINIWRMDHSDVLECIGGRCSYQHWRADGSIDTMRIVRDMVQDQNIGILDRFELACKFCLEEQIMSLGMVIRSRGELEKVKNKENWMVCFWIWWVKVEHTSPWESVLAKNLRLPSYLNPVKLRGRQSCFFPLLSPQQRRKFLGTVIYSSSDDFRFSLNVMTREEQLAVGTKNAMTFLIHHLQWPQRDSFLRIADRLWGYLKGGCFNCLLLLLEARSNDDPIFKGFFKEFWERSPPHLKRNARGYPIISHVLELQLPDDDKENTRQKR